MPMTISHVPRIKLRSADAHLAQDMDVFVTFYSAGAGGKCQIFIRCSDFPCV